MLLTAYADTEAAIKAINEIRLDYYLMKPWDPPEERLYPVLDDLLGDWQAGFRPPFEGIRVIGHRWSPEAHDVRDFLARNQVPYRWLDVETDAEAAQLMEAAGLDRTALPGRDLYADGTVLAHPTADRPGAKSRLAHRGLAAVLRPRHRRQRAGRPGGRVSTARRRA